MPVRLKHAVARKKNAGAYPPVADRPGPAAYAIDAGFKKSRKSAYFCPVTVAVRFWNMP